MATINSELDPLGTAELGFIGFPRNIRARFSRYLSEAAIAINDKFGIIDHDHRLYNVLAWVRGYYRDRGDNHGERYEALGQEQRRLIRILEARDIG